MHGAEDCGGVSGKLDRDSKGVPQGVSPHLLRTWTLVALTGSSYCWNNQGMDCEEGKKTQQFNICSLSFKLILQDKKHHFHGFSLNITEKPHIQVTEESIA